VFVPQMLAALFLAGVRNVNRGHGDLLCTAYFVIHARHLISLEAAGRRTVLPLFYAPRRFQRVQERDAKRGGDLQCRQCGEHFLPERAASELRRHGAWDFDAPSEPPVFR